MAKTLLSFGHSECSRVLSILSAIRLRVNNVKGFNTSIFLAIFSLPGQSPGRAIVLPLASALALASASA